MNPSDLQDETLFEGALKCRAPAERAAYLDRACAGQPELCRRPEELLAAHDCSGEFLEPTVVADRPTIALDLAPEETPGTMIGRYKLLQKIGEGGMASFKWSSKPSRSCAKSRSKSSSWGWIPRQW